MVYWYCWPVQASSILVFLPGGSFLVLVILRQVALPFWSYTSHLQYKPSNVCMYIERGSVVQEAAVSPLTTWQNFYVIIGSAAAALTGLMFVVITLITRTRVRGSSGTLAAFGTPNVVHFGAALLVAAILSAPWQARWNAGLLLGLCGLWGVTYAVIVVRRARCQTDYQPVLEDWLWHAVFPLVSYAVLVVAALLLLGNPALALFVIGAVTVLLLFIGIHNAWDTVTYVVLQQSQPENKSQD